MESLTLNTLMAAVLIFFLLKWDHYFIFGFLCLIKPDSDRISSLEPIISQKMGYYTVYVSHLGFFKAIRPQAARHVVPGYCFITTSISKEVVPEMVPLSVLQHQIPIKHGKFH